MKLNELRVKLKQKLSQYAIEPKDADFIIAEYLNCSVTELFKYDDIDEEQLNDISLLIERRINGEPVSSLFNKAYFYGLEFYVNKNVLTPRPETENVVECALSFIKDKTIRVLDLCTGSGCIACAIKKNSNAIVYASDISEKALEVAEKNAKELNLDINFIKSNMFSSIDETFDIIVSNPPYIETEVCKNLDSEVKNYDPMLALDGGADGLDFYRNIKNNLNKLNRNGVLIMEIGYNQGQSLKQIFKDEEVEILKDYNNLDRIVVVKNK